MERLDPICPVSSGVNEIVSEISLSFTLGTHIFSHLEKISSFSGSLSAIRKDINTSSPSKE